MSNLKKVRFRKNQNSPWTWAGPFGHNGKLHGNQLFNSYLIS